MAHMSKKRSTRKPPSAPSVWSSLRAVSTKPQRDSQRSAILRDLCSSWAAWPYVAPMGIDPDIDAVLALGCKFDARTARSVSGHDSDCHGNVSRLWVQRRGRMSIVTGYALSEDGLSRSHTWGVEDERVVETTEARILYYGVVLPAHVARQFAAACPTSITSPP